MFYRFMAGCITPWEDKDNFQIEAGDDWVFFGENIKTVIEEYTSRTKSGCVGLG